MLVVGSGPGGLTAAYHLRLLGHEVVVHESSPLPGGMMRYGIPAYRLPRDVVDAEIDRIVAMGVEMRLRAACRGPQAAMGDGRFDAAFVAVGAQRGRHADIPAGDSARILDAVSLLRDTEDDRGTGSGPAGRRSTAAGTPPWTRPARPAASEPRTPSSSTGARRERMPAHVEEVEDAVEEGVRLKWLSTIVGDDGGLLDHRADGA